MIPKLPKGCAWSQCWFLWINSIYWISKYFDVILVNISDKIRFVLIFSKSRKQLTHCTLYICVSSSSSSSCHATSMDIPDPFSSPFSIVYSFKQVFRATSHISTELLYVGSGSLSCLCSSMWRSPQEYITYEFVPTSPAVSHMSGSSNLDSFCDVAIQLLLCRVLPQDLFSIACSILV